MDEGDVVLPPQGQLQTITCVCITPTFIITGCRQVRHTLARLPARFARAAAVVQWQLLRAPCRMCR